MPKIIQIRGGKITPQSSILHRPSSPHALPSSPHALPGAAAIVRNALGAAARLATAAVKGHRLTVPPEVESARRALCEACPQYRPRDGRCQVCGCGTRGHILNKLQYAP